MELRLDIGLNEIIKLIRQLPAQKQQILKSALEKEIENTKNQDADLSIILMNGPVMSKEEYENFKFSQQQLEAWTKTLFA